jgi:methionyl-tRNA formyltransferase
MSSDQKPLRIVFMGTPEFAVETLSYLVRTGYNIVGVVTVPDKPAGRGRKIAESAVKQFTVQQQLPLLQPEKLSDPEFVDGLRDWNPDLIIVVAFRMLPEVVWRMPRLGTFNLHASLLPLYRGAAPIHRAIMDGVKTTGLTTFFIDHKIDTGTILLQHPMEVGDDETTGELHDRMIEAGGALVAATVDLIAAGKAQSVARAQQVAEPLPTAPKIFKEDTLIDWHRPAREIYNQIRGLSPSPGAVARFKHPTRGEITMKVFRARMIPRKAETGPPSMDTDGKSWLRINLPDGAMELLEVQLSDRKRMQIADLLRGFPLDHHWIPA